MEDLPMLVTYDPYYNYVREFFLDNEGNNIPGTVLFQEAATAWENLSHDDRIFFEEQYYLPARRALNRAEFFESRTQEKRNSSTVGRTPVLSIGSVMSHDMSPAMSHDMRPAMSHDMRHDMRPAMSQVEMPTPQESWANLQENLTEKRVIAAVISICVFVALAYLLF